MVDAAVAVGPFAGDDGAVHTWLATGYDFDTPGGFELTAALDLMGSFGSCLDTCAVEVRVGHVDLGSSNEPPTVDQEASDVTGPEGATLATGGTFVDPDGDPLTIQAAGSGVLTDGGDGTWSWVFAPGDDGTGEVVVTASDDAGGEVSDRFTWVASNVAPTITGLEPDVTTTLPGHEVTWTVSATDPGPEDVFGWSFEGGAGAASGSPATYTTSYGACGTYRLDATVADDDGGSASALSEATVTVIGASVLEPAAGGLVVVGPRGRVLPLKVRVGCEGRNLSGLQPEVRFGGLPVGTMREQDGFYRMNLRVDRQGTIRIVPFGDGAALEIEVEVRSSP